jgi:hypothetical protein
MTSVSEDDIKKYRYRHLNEETYETNPKTKSVFHNWTDSSVAPVCVTHTSKYLYR